MGRSADYSIQGYLYQFNKALLEVLSSSEDDPVTIEGIIEDVEVKLPTGVKAIQCKYHEAGGEQFTLSAIYKPVLQMMSHYYNHQAATINYVLFIYHPGLPQGYKLTEKETSEIFKTTNSTLNKYVVELSGKLDQAAFLERFELHVGQSLDDLTKQVHEELERSGIEKDDIKDLSYPNALHAVAMMSIKHNASERVMRKRELLAELKRVKVTAISRWTLALKRRSEILKARRHQLGPNLSKNARRRCLAISGNIEGFNELIVEFVCDLLDRYHFKSLHSQTPILCLACPPDTVENLELRLYKRGVICTTGLVGGQLEPTHLFREPFVKKDLSNGQVKREFSLRLMRWEDASLLNTFKPQDLFLVGGIDCGGLDTQDISLEILEPTTMKELAYLMRLSESHE